MLVLHDRTPKGPQTPLTARHLLYAIRYDHGCYLRTYVMVIHHPCRRPRKREGIVGSRRAKPFSSVRVEVAKSCMYLLGPLGGVLRENFLPFYVTAVIIMNLTSCGALRLAHDVRIKTTPSSRVNTKPTRYLSQTYPACRIRVTISFFLTLPRY